MVGLPSFKTTSDFMKFCLKMHKKGRLVRLYRLNFSCFRTAKPWQDEEKFYSDLQSMLPNIPVRHWWEHRDENVAESCWKVPNIVDLKYNNKYWHIGRSRRPVREHSKVLTPHNHYPLSCLGPCSFHSVPPSVAQLQHYREDCVADLRTVCQAGDTQRKMVFVNDLIQIPSQTLIPSTCVLSSARKNTRRIS